MYPEPFVSRAKASPAKRSNKGYGDENGQVVVVSRKVCFSRSMISFAVLFVISTIKTPPNFSGSNLLWGHTVE